MAYDFTKEKAEIIASVEKNDRGDHVQVRRITKPDKTQVIDIREFYLSKSDMTTHLPTQRGLRLNDEVIVDVVAAILKGMNKYDVGEALAKYAESLSLETDEDAEDPLVRMAEALDQDVLNNFLYVLAERAPEDDGCDWDANGPGAEEDE